MLEAKQDDFRHHIIKIAGAERAGEAHRRMIVLADADEVDGAGGALAGEDLLFGGPKHGFC